MNVIEAVRKLQADGGRLRRAGWREDEHIFMADEGRLYFSYSMRGPQGDPLVNPMRGYCRGQPNVDDILTLDWEWEADPPKAEPKPTDPIPASAWEETIEIPAWMLK
jgi:hypothetical protein